MIARFTRSSSTLLVVFLLLLAGLVRPAAANEGCGIASAHALATRAGCEILASGGNAFDAAVAVAAALAVVEPFSSGIGGGGFMLLHRASDGFDVFVDARETAPSRATREFFLDENGKPKPRASLDGATAAGIPGEPAALDWVASRYGRLPLAKLLAPAIRLAEQGFPADGRFASATTFRLDALKADPGSAESFLDNGKAVATGFIVVQPKLARTLRMLAREGAKGFYHGEFAQKLAAAVNQAGGLWEISDLESYGVIEREPVRFNYRGARITTAPLPSSGGLVLAQCLFILEGVDLAGMSDADRTHYVAEAMRRGYQDRARYMGDPAFVKVPVEKLLSRDYAIKRGASIDPARATPSADLAAGAGEAEDTTHFSIIDADGNRVAATMSVNGVFGSGFVPADTGVLLNNHMDDFALAPGAANLYKLVGSDANAVAPGKRPLSSMSPTFVEDDRGVLVLGTPGGSRIISMVLEGILNYVGHPQVDLVGIVAAPRFHHQYLPDRIEIEPGAFGDSWIAALKAKGHAVESGRRRWGNMQAVFRDRKSGRIETANDPRGQSGVLF
ncbi:MAG TPA: gamma-glutamyltransferase [Burkholderiales bacterium]|nr:gamma-glutamyltransferase [Burkholderiales bacterium]